MGDTPKDVCRKCGHEFVEDDICDVTDCPCKGCDRTAQYNAPPDSVRRAAQIKTMAQRPLTPYSPPVGEPRPEAQELEQPCPECGHRLTSNLACEICIMRRANVLADRLQLEIDCTNAAGVPMYTRHFKEALHEGCDDGRAAELETVRQMHRDVAALPPRSLRSRALAIIQLKLLALKAPNP